MKLGTVLLKNCQLLTKTKMYKNWSYALRLSWMQSERENLETACLIWSRFKFKSNNYCWRRWGEGRDGL